MTEGKRDDADASSEAPPPEDVGAGLRFVHLMEAQTKARLAEVSSSVNALVETLVGAGVLPLEAFERRRRLTVVRENEHAATEANIAINDVPDKYSLGPLPEIDCASLLPLCHARCCKLPFALSVQDLDERVVRWNYARPYVIAQDGGGTCVHNEAGRCGVYEHRPAACRKYDCRADRRIWIDFEKRIVAP